YAVAHKQLRPSIKAGTPSSVAHLIRRCWAEDPKDRPDFTEILDTLLTLQRNLTEGATHDTDSDGGRSSSNSRIYASRTNSKSDLAVPGKGSQQNYGSLSTFPPMSPLGAYVMGTKGPSHVFFGPREGLSAEECDKRDAEMLSMMQQGRGGRRRSSLGSESALSDHVPSPQIAILPGLCSCAAYVSHGGGFAGRALGIVGASEQAGNSLTSSAEFSLLSQKAVESASPSAQFLAAMEEAAVRADATPGRVAVAVTHREGMRDMKDLIEGAEGRLRLPYCALAGIVAQVEGGRVAGWEWEGVWAGEDVEAGVRASVERLRLVPKV
ncbi:hypothetical protein TeGR_g3489, partial [Tetraparma gracilis]